LKEVWMLDDNVRFTYYIQAADGGRHRARPLVASKCSFVTPMRGVEAMLDQSREKDIDIKGSDDLPEHVEFFASDFRKSQLAPLLEESERARFLSVTKGSLPKGPMPTLGSFSGSGSSYAIIGIHRDVSRGCSQKVKHPFHMTHSVYSFFLLTVEVTVSQGVLYPAKSFWEDIEFLHLVSEHNLAICKFNKYFHRKNHTRPPPPVKPSPLQQCLLSLGNFSLCHAVGSLTDEVKPIYKDVDGMLTIPINTTYQWLHSANSGDDDDTRSSLLRWIVDSEAQDEATLLVIYEAPDIAISIENLFHKLTVPHINALATERQQRQQSPSAPAPTELLLLVKVQSEPSMGDKTKPLRGVEDFDEDWVIKMGGEVLRDNLSHDGDKFFLSKLPWPSSSGSGALVVFSPIPNPLGMAPTAGLKHSLPSSESQAAKKPKFHAGGA